MATVNIYGPYWVILANPNFFQPGGEEITTFNEWPGFGSSVVSVTVNPDDVEFGVAQITVESVTTRELVNGARLVDVLYRNSGTSPLQRWNLYITITTP